MEQPITEGSQQVKAQLETLIQLQELDSKIRQRRRQIEGLQEQIRQGEQNTQNLTQSLDGHKQALDQLLKDRREAERTVKEREEQVSKLSGQVFDVKTNEAYNTLQAEIKQKKQENAVLEERILEMMMSEDEMRAALDKAAVGLQEQQKQVTALQEEKHREISQVESEIAALRSDWEQVAKDLPANVLDRYQRLRDAKDGLALAKIENGICTGCRLTIRPQAVIELKKYRALLLCDNCARILYVD